MKKLLAAALGAGALIAATVVPAAAITDGQPDGNGHPYVGLMVAQDAAGNPMWRCSGTLISPRLFLTAGHCTSGAAHVEIWFDADVESGIPTNGYPFTGQTGGTPYTHPSYIDENFAAYDLGMVVLAKPYKMAKYGALPKLDVLDTLAAKKSTLTFTAVGYGLQESFPDAASWQENNVRVRMVAYPKINQINAGIAGTQSLLLSNNTNTGGTCFGDSGGPNFIGDTNVVGGVTSFGLNGTCGGTGGVYRVDRADDLTWIQSAFGRYL
jgi:V8-like Glu-specific endopeptidase